MAENSENLRLLTFSVGEIDYAADILSVTDIIEVPKITFVPKLPEYIRGVINLRGKVIPVLDFAKRFGAEDEKYDGHSCIIVCVVHGNAVGFLVKSVGDVIDVFSSQLSENPNRKSFVDAVVTTQAGLLQLVNLNEIVDA